MDSGEDRQVQHFRFQDSLAPRSSRRRRRFFSLLILEYASLWEIMILDWSVEMTSFWGFGQAFFVSLCVAILLYLRFKGMCWLVLVVF